MAITETEPTDLPHWDVSGFYPSLSSREFTSAHEYLVADVGRLKQMFDDLGIRGGERREVTDADVAAIEAVIPAANELQDEMRLLGAYLYAHISTDARDAEAANLQSRFQADTASVATLTKRFGAWLASIGAEGLIERSPVAADHAFPLRRSEAAAAHQMAEGEEDLASELSLTGGRAWSRLHGEMTSRMSVSVPVPGESTPRELPMSAVRGLATDPDPVVRQAAFEAEVAAWETVAVPLATALNAFKGESNTLNRRRGWTDSLDVALFNNNVDRETLAAMQEAVVASLPDFARYNKAKAGYLARTGGWATPRNDVVADNGGWNREAPVRPAPASASEPAGRDAPEGIAQKHGLPWWDELAPLGDSRRFDWSEAITAVQEAFASYSPQLAALVGRAVDEQWLDAEPRSGKVGGAFCMPVEGEVSRVLLNFDGSFDSVQTLAHELGHAYHNTQLGHRTPMQRATPMALAETASIFCETIMVQSGLATAPDDGVRLAILDLDLAGATQVVADIHSRFLFERAMTKEREQGVLSVDRLCELMLQAQRDSYLDGLDHDHLHPYMWAVKGHYYTAYYNWPYTFGLLFGLGLYAEYQQDPERFRLGYDDLLSATGLGQADELAARFGIDVRSVEFWTASLDVHRARIDEFCRLTGA